MARSGVSDLKVQAGAGANASTRGMRHPSVSSDATTKKGRQQGDAGQTKRREWNTAVRQMGRKLVTNRARREPIRPLIAVLYLGLMAEVVLPWSVIWLSDTLLFDTPAWSLWLMFGTPAAFTLLAALACFAMELWRKSRPAPLELRSVSTKTGS